MKSRLTIRAQLLALVTAIALPMAGIIAYTIYDNAQQRIVEAQSIARTLVVATSSDVDRVLIANRDLLVQMSKRSLIQKMDGKHCDQVLWNFRELFPKSANMTVIDMQGTAICSAVPQPGGKPVSVAKADMVQEVAGRRWLCGERSVFWPYHRQVGDRADLSDTR